MSWADSAALVNQAMFDEFGETVTYIPIAGNPVDIKMVWREDPLIKAERQGVQAGVFAMWVDFPGDPQQSAKILRNGIVYVIVEKPKDGRDDTGGVTLYLRRE